MADMLVNLITLPQFDIDAHEKKANVKIFRPLAPDKQGVLNFVKELSGVNAMGEMDVCFAHFPPTCFVATIDGELVGYSCYDAVAKDFFGPTAVKQEHRGKGIGKLLLFKTLYAMRECGYVYAIIGCIGPREFYEKTVNAKIIDENNNSIYSNFLNLAKR